MAHSTDPKESQSLASLCDEDSSSFDELFLEEIPVSEFIMQDLMDGADLRSQVGSCTSSHTEESDSASNTLHGQDRLSCCSIYDTQMDSHLSWDMESPETSPGPHRKKHSSRKDKNPDTLLAVLEKHRHSERIRHHTLNERLKVICKLVPGSAEDGKETKVVMMQRIICYIAYLENTVDFLCSRFGIQPHRNWLLLTNNSKDCLGKNNGKPDEELTAATKPLEEILNEDSCASVSVSVRRMKVSSPTVDSTTDSVVPDMVAHGEEDGGILSQDSGVPSSSGAREDYHMWSITHEQGVQGWPTAESQAGVSSGDLEAFFSSAVDEGISAVFEVPSSTFESPPRVGTAAVSGDVTFRKGSAQKESLHQASVGATADSVLAHSQHLNPVHEAQRTQFGAKYKVQSYTHKNKRKQYSPKRSMDAEDDWQEDIAAKYEDVVANAECQTSAAQMRATNKTGLRDVVQVLPYNIRCNHRHLPHRRMYFTRSSLMDCPLMRIIKPDPRPARIASYCPEEKAPARMDLRKTSWMNGFMMFSRLNRRKYIQAHPGVHTSHISKIMGHAWRSMSPEEQAPYKEKAKLCAQELYRSYTSTPDFRSAVTSTWVLPAVSATTSSTATSPDSMASAAEFPSTSSSLEIV